MSGRYVVLGLAHPRSTWFRNVAQWSHGGSLPAEFVKCLSTDELFARLDSGRPVSAVLIDGGLPSVDRDLLASISTAGAASLVVADSRSQRQWETLGAHQVLDQGFSRAELLDALASHARLIDRATQHPIADSQPSVSPLTAKVIAVTGSGGTGTSTAAIALSQALATTGRSVALLDLQLHAEQSMLHDVTDPTGGLQALVDAHRNRSLDPTQIDSFMTAVPHRGYSLLPGLRRARFWSSIRPAAFAAAFATIRSSFDLIICDVSSDCERETVGGSIDVEERSAMSRTAIEDASAVFAVGHPSVKGLHALNRVLIDLGELGVPAENIAPVFNQSPRTPKVRAGYNGALAELISYRDGAAHRVTPVHVPSRPIDACIRSGTAFPEAITQPLLGAASVLLDGSNVERPRASLFARIKPGSLRMAGSEELAS
jgi:hypothetical protein